MTWVSLALALLQAAASLLSWLREKNQITAGQDAEIAKATAAILSKTQTAKQIMADITGMSDAQVDDALKKLEP